jgi:hypothetical protein
LLAAKRADAFFAIIIDTIVIIIIIIIIGIFVHFCCSEHISSELVCLAKMTTNFFLSIIIVFNIVVIVFVWQR